MRVQEIKKHTECKKRQEEEEEKEAKRRNKQSKVKKREKKKRQRNKPLRKLIDFLTCHTAEVHSPYEAGCPPLTPPPVGAISICFKGKRSGHKM